VAAQAAAEAARTGAETAENNAVGSAAAAASSASDAATFALLNTTSTSSVAISLGTKIFTSAADRAFVVGQFVMVARTAAPTTHFMWGQVTGWNSGTNALTLDVQVIAGSGSYAAWTISGTGARGPQGAQGDQGIQGIQGEQGIQGVAGADGADGADGDDGADGVNITAQGTYAGGTIYGLNDGVTYQGSFWRSLQAGNTGNAPDLSPAFWEQTVAKGDTGDTGADGADGSGVPAGGTTGQALVKASGSDGDVEWADHVPMAVLDQATYDGLTPDSGTLYFITA
jgi:hypothetical protein